MKHLLVGAPSLHGIVQPGCDERGPARLRGPRSGRKADRRKTARNTVVGVARGLLGRLLHWCGQSKHAQSTAVAGT